MGAAEGVRRLPILDGRLGRGRVDVRFSPVAVPAFPPRTAVHAVMAASDRRVPELDWVVLMLVRPDV
jgi:hypothetical protein